MNKETMAKALDAWWTKNKANAASELAFQLSEQEPERKEFKELPPVVEAKLNIVEGPKMPVQGKYALGGPVGAVIHFTAGRYKNGVKDALSTATAGASMGYAYWLIARDGTVVKTHELDSWGWHAGPSHVEGLGFSVSKHLLGIEICCAGNLNLNGDAWWGENIPADEIVEIKNPRDPREEKGLYHKFSKEQEEALVELLCYLKRRDPKNFNLDFVVAHHEICEPRGRKPDCGGSLSMGMPELRRILKAKF